MTLSTDKELGPVRVAKRWRIERRDVISWSPRRGEQRAWTEKANRRHKSRVFFRTDKDLSHVRERGVRHGKETQSVEKQ